MSKCPDCLHEWDGRMCARCGYQSGAAMVTPNALPPDTVLVDRYVLGNALVVSRQSIAYAAWDEQLEQRVIITEFYPAVIVKRIQGEVQPQRNQVQFQAAMKRYQEYVGQQVLPLEQAFFGRGTTYRVYAAAEQPQLKVQADMLLDQPILFRNEAGQPQMTINALMIDPLPKERPFNRVGNPGRKKMKKVLAAILSLMLVLVISCVVVLPMLQGQPPVETDIPAAPTATPAVTSEGKAQEEAVPVSAPDAISDETEALPEETGAASVPPETVDVSDNKVNTAPEAENTSEPGNTAPAASPVVTDVPAAEASETPAEESVPTKEVSAAPVETPDPTPMMTDVPAQAEQDAPETEAPEQTADANIPTDMPAQSDKPEALEEDIPAQSSSETVKEEEEDGQAASAEPDATVPAQMSSEAPDQTPAPTVQITEVPDAAEAVEDVSVTPEVTEKPIPAALYEPWYLKVNGQLWRVNEEGAASEVKEAVPGLQLDTVSIPDLKRYRDIYSLNKADLYSDKTKTSFDLFCEQKPITSLELPSGSYKLTVGRTMEFADGLRMVRQQEYLFSTDQRTPVTDAAAIEQLCEEWYHEFADAEMAEMLKLSNVSFYKAGSSYFGIGKDGALDILDSNQSAVFCLIGENDQNEPSEYKIPLYPVQVQLDRALFNKVLLPNQGEARDKGELAVGDDGKILFYASQGDHKLNVRVSEQFTTVDGMPCIISAPFAVEENSELLVIDDAGMKAEVFKKCGLWAYQLGQNPVMICGSELEQETLAAMFGSLLEKDEEYALHEVTFANVMIGGKPLVSAGACVKRAGVEILLAELTPDVTEAELNEAVDAAEAPAADVESPVTVPMLKLTNGVYDFYPAGGETLGIKLTVKGPMDVTLTEEQQQEILRKIAEAGVGYIAGVEAEGLFIYQMDAGQMKFTAAEVNALDAEAAAAQQKFRVTFDCTSRDMKTAEKASMGIVYVGSEAVTNPAEFTFAANDELKKLEMVSLKELASWDGEMLTLLLGPGTYHLCYTGADEENKELIVRFSGPFTVGEDLTLKLANECKHKKYTTKYETRTCLMDGKTWKECKDCGIDFDIKIDKALGHDMLPPTCVNPATCSICGAPDSSHFPALGHTEVPMAPVEATCAKPGLTGGKKCSVCNTVTEQQKEVPQKEHTKETMPAKAATCMDTGLTEGVRCSVCSAVLVAQQVVPTTACDNEFFKKEEPTCTSPGKEYVKCKVCGAIVWNKTADPDPSKHRFDLSTGKCTNPGCTATNPEFGKSEELQEQSPLPETNP